MKKVFIVIILLSYVSVGFGQIDRFKNRIDKEISPIIMSQANKILENRDFGLNKDSVCVYPFYIFDQINLHQIISFLILRIFCFN